MHTPLPIQRMLPGKIDLFRTDDLSAVAAVAARHRVTRGLLFPRELYRLFALDWFSELLPPPLVITFAERNYGRAGPLLNCLDKLRPIRKRGWRTVARASLRQRSRSRDIPEFSFAFDPPGAIDAFQGTARKFDNVAP